MTEDEAKKVVRWISFYAVMALVLILVIIYLIMATCCYFRANEIESNGESYGIESSYYIMTHYVLAPGERHRGWGFVLIAILLSMIIPIMFIVRDIARRRKG